MKRKDWIDESTVKEYKTLAQKLRVADTYRNCGVVATFLNRLNPLTYIYLLITLLVMPLYCMFTENKMQDGLEVIIEGLMGEEI